MINIQGGCERIYAYIYSKYGFKNLVGFDTIAITTTKCFKTRAGYETNAWISLSSC